MRAVRKTKPMSGAAVPPRAAANRDAVERAALQERADRDMEAWNEVNRRHGSVADEFCEL